LKTDGRPDPAAGFFGDVDDEKGRHREARSAPLSVAGAIQGPAPLDRDAPAGLAMTVKEWR
jgi:hypothetical protein